MKILKRYILELCFILSFALPFLKGANADNGRRFVEIYYGFTFLMEHAIVTQLPSIFLSHSGYVNDLQFKSNYGKIVS